MDEKHDRKDQQDPAIEFDSRTRWASEMPLPEREPGDRTIKKERTLNRRTFLGALAGGAVAAGAGILAGDAALAQSAVMGINSFGATVPASPYSLSVGVYPPPLPNAPPGPFAHMANPNILVILVDQLRNPTWFPSGSYTDFDTTLPNLARLRQHSFVFNNYYTAASPCTPARATLLTGLYSQETCIFTNQDSATAPPLNPNFDTYGDAAQNAGFGYQSYWFGKWHVSNEDIDGDAYDSDLSQYGFNSTYGPAVPNASVPSPNGSGNEGTEGPSSPTAANMSDGGVFSDFDTWINHGVATTQKWCATVSFINPHDITHFPFAFFQSQLSGGGCPGSLPGLCGPAAPFSCFPAPPTAGSPPAIPALPSPYSGLPPNQTINGQSNVPWNGNEDVSTLPYGVGGKPDVQTLQQSYYKTQKGYVVPKATDPANWAIGWTEFLNYYIWMEACVDYWIGQVMTDLQTAQTGAFWANTVVIFTSDHGDFAGSHAMRAKAGALYDEAINVPLYVSYPGQRGTPANYNGGNPNYTNLSYMCSSVDFLPMIYTIAKNSFSWRLNSGDPYYYLAGREAIMDAIWFNGTGHSRTVTINVNGSNIQYNYILHTTDETYGSTTSPTHGIGMRTVKSSDSSPGAKYGIYTTWATCATSGNAAVQYEFYDYAGNWVTPNPAETGNDALVSINPVTLSAGAQAYNYAFQSIVQSELYGQTMFGTYPSTLGCYHDQALYTLLGSSCVTLPPGCPAPPPVG
jgi:hypothetical protein